MKLGIQRAALVAAILAAGASAVSAGERAANRHHHARAVVHAAPVPETFGGGRLVMHPASNIACQTRDRATRALPCDQPVWIYGSPCEIDLGLGRWRDCDDPPGVVRGGAHHRSW